MEPIAPPSASNLPRIGLRNPSRARAHRLSRFGRSGAVNSLAAQCTSVVTARRKGVPGCLLECRYRVVALVTRTMVRLFRAAQGFREAGNMGSRDWSQGSEPRELRSDPPPEGSGPRSPGSATLDGGFARV